MRARFRESAVDAVGAAAGVSLMSSRGGAWVELACAFGVAAAHAALLLAATMAYVAPQAARSAAAARVAAVAMNVLVLVNAHDAMQIAYRWHSRRSPQTQLQAVIVATFLLGSALLWHACRLFANLEERSLEARFVVLFLAFSGVLFALATALNTMLLDMPLPRDYVAVVPPTADRELDTLENADPITRLDDFGFNVGDNTYLSGGFFGSALLGTMGLFNAMDVASCSVEYAALLKVLMLTEASLTAVCCIPLYSTLVELLDERAHAAESNADASRARSRNNASKKKGGRARESKHSKRHRAEASTASESKSNNSQTEDSIAQSDNYSSDEPSSRRKAKSQRRASSRRR